MKFYKNNCNIPLSLQINDSLNFLTQSTQSMQTILKYDNVIPYANVIEDFVVSEEINYACMASS